jgi:hypothetical protein
VARTKLTNPNAKTTRRASRGPRIFTLDPATLRASKTVPGVLYGDHLVVVEPPPGMTAGEAYDLYQAGENLGGPRPIGITDAGVVLEPMRDMLFIPAQWHEHTIAADNREQLLPAIRAAVAYGVSPRDLRLALRGGRYSVRFTHISHTAPPPDLVEALASPLLR